MHDKDGDHKDGCHTTQYAIATNPMLHANFMALCFIERELVYGWKFYFAGIGIFNCFCSCDRDLDLMTFIYERDLYSWEIYRMCKNELRTSRLLKVISYCLIDRQTDTTELYTMLLCGWSDMFYVSRGILVCL